MSATFSLNCRNNAIALSLAAFLLSGCAGHLSRPNLPPTVAAQSPNGVGNYTLDNYKADLTSYADAEKSGSTADAVRIRNKIVYNIAAEIDFAFYDYETRLFLNEGKFHIGTDFLQLGLAAGSTVSMGARG